MCNYWHGCTIECRGDGFMWDADYDGYDPDDHSMPCPACNTAQYLADAKEYSESVSFSSSGWHSMTGEDAWRGAVKVAVAANPHMAPKLLRHMVVRPIMDDPADRAAFIEKYYDHRNERIVVSRRVREAKGGIA